jgi:adenylate kinase
MCRAAFFGLPTAGKSTLSHLVAARLGVRQINVGEILRGLDEHAVDPGSLVPDELVTPMVARELAQDAQGGFVLDGFPRTLSQLCWFEASAFSAGCRYVLLDISLGSVRRRFLGRANCLSCRRAEYSAGAGVRCSRCGGTLVRRADNNRASLRRKLAEFRENEAPMLRSLHARGRLDRLSVCGDAEQDLEPLLRLMPS